MNLITIEKLVFDGENSPLSSYSNSCQEIVEGSYALACEMIVPSQIDRATPVNRLLFHNFGIRLVTIRVLNHSPLDFVPGL
jgi:hypothetical protein